LVRVHQPRFDGCTPNPCLGGLTRFAPLSQPDGACLPTLYAGEDFECAVFESIFHDVPPLAGDKFVRMSRVTAMAVSWIITKVALKVARLNEPDLNKLGTTRSELIDTPASQYAITARCAEAFHRADPELAGLVWTSRRCDPAQAFVFFGDRLPPGALEVQERVELAKDGARFAQVAEFGRRAGIILST
jgi:hypothetical protein